MYYPLLVLFYAVAILPLKLLYLVSDIGYFVLYRIVGYRKKLVYDNLKYAFPEKEDADLRELCRRFYRNFCDQWIETLKLLTMSDRQLNKRLRANWDVVNDLYKEQRSVYFYTGHAFNWEWVNAGMQLNAGQTMITLYNPVVSKIFDKLMRKIRGRGGVMLSINETKTYYSKYRQQLHILGLAADQNPSNLNKVEWIPFFNRDTPFFTGSAQMAIKNKMAIVLGACIKPKRGYYELKLVKLCDDASQMSPHDIMHAYAQYLEQIISEQPDNYMWTHNRWKYQKPMAQ